MRSSSALVKSLGTIERDIDDRCWRSHEAATLDDIAEKELEVTLASLQSGGKVASA